MTDPIRTLLARVKELDEKAAFAPWWTNRDVRPPTVFSGDGSAADVAVLTAFAHSDAKLAAEYRTLAPQFARALEAVLEVHQPFIWDFGYGPLESCKGCADQGAGDHDYPCPTVRAITEHLGGVL